MTAAELRTVWEQAQQAMLRFADRGENSELRPRAAIQVHTPPRLQGRVNAAWTMLILTPQTASIAAGAVLISFVDYRPLLIRHQRHHRGMRPYAADPARYAV